MQTTVLGITVLLSTSAFAAGGGLKKNSSAEQAKGAVAAVTKSNIHDGNRILTIFYDYGGIANWTIGGRLNSGIYPKGSGHSYLAEFSPIVGAEVKDANGLQIHIFSDTIS